MSRRVWWVMAVLCALVVLAPRAMAQRPPDLDPVGAPQQSHVISYDRSSMPGEIVLYARRTPLGYNLDQDLGYGRIHLTCRSETDAKSGKCRTIGDGTTGSRATEIPLRFVERRSGLWTEINVVGSLQRAYGDQRCYRGYWEDTDRPIHTTFGATCIDAPAVGTGVDLRIPNGELAKLVAGHWDAELILDLHVDVNGGVIGTHAFTFDFTITDHNAVSIYFPLFDQVTPHVGLNLQYDPIAQTVGGRTQLDMCLYDGLGSQSQYLGVTVRDSGPRPPGPSGYSVWHTDGGSDATQRVDYTVTLDHNGSALPMRNGVEQLLHGIDTAKLRLVLLPGMTQPVFCVPTPLTLDTPRVPVSSKRPGYYDGDLKVELRVPTVTP